MTDLRKHLSSMPVAALALESDGRIIAANAQAFQLLDGGSPLEGRSLAEIFQSEPPEAVAGFLRDLAQPGSVSEVHARRTDQHPSFFIIRGSRGADGECIICVPIEVTPWLKRAEELELSLREAEEELRTRTQFLSRLSHEIRSALASMIGVADMMRDQAGEEKKELAQIITISGRHLLETLNAVMEMARLEIQQESVELTRVDVVGRLRERVTVLDPLARRKGIELLFKPEVDRAYGLLNRAFLDRIIHNLLDNAIKYTDEGKVEASVETRDGFIWLYIADTGIGIERSFLPRLFEPFEREKRKEEAWEEGIGLGLTITRHLVETMGGRVYVCSTPGSGSTFTVQFPLPEKQNGKV